MNAETQYTIWSGDIDLAAPIARIELPPTSTGGSFDAVRLLVRLNGEPMGFVEVPATDAVVESHPILETVRLMLGAQIHQELAAQGLVDIPLEALPSQTWAPPSAAPELSRTIVICTRDRTESLERTLNAIRRSDPGADDVIVVDNAPASNSTRELVARWSREDPRVRYLLEPVPGLSRGRNAAIREIRTELTVFVDDDVVVDDRWAQGVLRGFARADDVGCVTGLIASASLERPTEQYFDGRVSWSSNCEHRIYRYERGPLDSPLHPYAPGSIGAGANLSFRTEALQAIGGFDERLGVGTPTRGGEDLDIFVQVMRAGWAISYEPFALVWHAHRIDDGSLRRQMQGYGSGFSAYLFKQLLSKDSGPELIKRGVAGAQKALWLRGRSRDAKANSGLPDGVAGAELGGLAAGPWLYLKSSHLQRSRDRAIAAGNSATAAGVQATAAGAQASAEGVDA